ncbi:MULTISPECIES: ABC transporter permease [Streptomyces]|uniref:ABC transporter permease n=1 Tax=Streptomyces TaxID=1883 RepID=UPI000A37B12D|nr:MULTISPECIES: ABC transporter permease [Streptomyces]MDI3100167.1 FtsX-like permease family protein [Streptomyces sp. AN-3]WDI17170.1 FtsX-like permease family protein [Streptomyces enissocaesilis]WMI60434.1 FtsX-like permease family protein [Streptomyces rochei]
MFFTYLRRELRRRRKSALVVASGLALGIALVIVVNAVSTGMGKAQDQVLESLYGLGTDMTVTKAPEPPSEDGGERPRFRFDAGDGEDGEQQSSDRVMVQGLQTLDAATVSSVAKADGVADAVGGLSLNVVKVDGEFSRGQFQQRPGAGGGGPTGDVTGGGADFSIDSFTVYGTDVAHPDMGPLSSSEITDGRGFETSEASAKVAVVDSAYAQEKKLAIGDTVTVSETKFEIIGVATATSGDAAANVYLPLGQAQTLADAKDKITTVYVQADDAQQLGAVESAVLKAVPDATVTTSEDLADTVSGSLSTASGLAETVGRWLSVVVLAAAFLVAGLLTSSAVTRRVREFGTLKALGWRSRRVTGQVVGEAVVTGLVGGALGIGLGLAGAWAVTAFGPSLSAELGASGGGMSGPGGGGGMGGRGGGMGGGAARETAARTLDVVLTAPVSLSVIVLAVGLAVAGGLVAGGFGGWRASRLRPADALSRVA